MLQCEKKSLEMWKVTCGKKTFKLCKQVEFQYLHKYSVVCDLAYIFSLPSVSMNKHITLLKNINYRESEHWLPFIPILGMTLFANIFILDFHCVL